MTEGPNPDEGAVTVADDASLDILASNRAGQATALTTLTPFPRIWSRPLKLVLRVKTWVGPDKTLLRLSFIHVAHWVIMDHFPGEKQPNRYSYLLFASNFNGSWLDYIDSFSVAVPKKMNLLWGSSFGYPGAIPPRPFTDYIRGDDKRLDHYYSAYPEATTTEVASAFRVREGFDSKVAAALAAPDDRHLARAWRAFLDDVQRDL